MNQQPEIPPDKLIEEPYSFSKDKIGRELGYPLKSSLLDSALHSASVYACVLRALFGTSKFRCCSGCEFHSRVERAPYRPRQVPDNGVGRSKPTAPRGGAAIDG